MEFELGFLDEKGIDTKLGIEYTGGKEKYLSSLKRYFSNYERNLDKIKRLYEANDLENLAIQVHALKSNSKMLGACGLSEDFEALEMAASAGNINYIADNLEKCLLHYKEFALLLSPIGNADIEIPSDEISAETAKKVSRELLGTLDDFDDERSMELAKKLSGYPFRLTQKEKLKMAVKLIADFNYDDAAEIIKDISETIE